MWPWWMHAIVSALLIGLPTWIVAFAFGRRKGWLEGVYDAQHADDPLRAGGTEL